MQDLVIEWKEDGTHLYEQIYQYIRDEIRRGKLLCQEKLPSTRSLAEYLQVSRSTVELAYDQLVAEGDRAGRRNNVSRTGWRLFACRCRRRLPFPFRCRLRIRSCIGRLVCGATRFG